MKKILSVAVLLLTVSALSFGQSAVANVSANVNASLTITNTSALAIGNVVQGGTASIASAATGSAAFTIGGAANATSTITVTYPDNLTFGTNNLPFTLAVPKAYTANTPGSSVALTGWSAAAGTGSGNATTSSTGALYVWVGGSVTAGSSQAAGSYTGTITVSVAQP